MGYSISPHTLSSPPLPTLSSSLHSSLPPLTSSLLLPPPVYPLPLLLPKVVDARSEGRFDGTAPEPVAGVPSGHMMGALNLPFVKMVDQKTRLMVSKQQIQEGLSAQLKRWMLICVDPGTSSVQEALVPVLFRRPWYQFCSEGPGNSSVQKVWYQFCSEGPGTSSVQEALVPVLFRRPWYQFCSGGLVPVLFRRPWYQFCSGGLVPVLFRRLWYQFCSGGPGTSSEKCCFVLCFINQSPISHYQYGPQT